MSFVVAEQIDEGVPEIVQALAASVAPIALRAPSWTVFTGPPPILPGIVRVVLRLSALDAAHRQVAAAVGPHLPDVSPLTEHDEWNPHVTLAAWDVGIERVGPVIRWLAENDHPAWEGRITRLGSIVDDNGRHDLACAHPLGGD